MKKSRLLLLVIVVIITFGLIGFSVGQLYKELATNNSKNKISLIDEFISGKNIELRNNDNGLQYSINK